MNLRLTFNNKKLFAVLVFVILSIFFTNPAVGTDFEDILRENKELIDKDLDGKGEAPVAVYAVLIDSYEAIIKDIKTTLYALEVQYVNNDLSPNINPKEIKSLYKQIDEVERRYYDTNLRDLIAKNEALTKIKARADALTAISSQYIPASGFQNLSNNHQAPSKTSKKQKSSVATNKALSEIKVDNFTLSTEILRNFLGNSEGKYVVPDCAGQEESLKKIISFIFRIIFSLTGLAAVISIVYGGFMMIAKSSVGNAAGVSDAKKILGNALGGIVILLLSWILLNTINPSFTEITISCSSSI